MIDKAIALMKQLSDKEITLSDAGWEKLDKQLKRNERLLKRATLSEKGLEKIARDIVAVFEEVGLLKNTANVTTNITNRGDSFKEQAIELRGLIEHEHIQQSLPGDSGTKPPIDLL